MADVRGSIRLQTRSADESRLLKEIADCVRDAAPSTGDSWDDSSFEVAAAFDKLERRLREMAEE